MANIFDFQLAQTQNCIPSSLSVLPEPENVGVAVGIYLLSCVFAEICATEFSKPPSWISDFRLLPFDLQLTIIAITPVFLTVLCCNR